MTSTLDQLRQNWDTPCPTMTDVRERYFSHIRTDRRFRELIRDGEIQLKITKLHRSIRAQHVVYLSDLAIYLDSQATHSI